MKGTAKPVRGVPAADSLRFPPSVPWPPALALTHSGSPELGRAAVFSLPPLEQHRLSQRDNAVPQDAAIRTDADRSVKRQMCLQQLRERESGSRTAKAVGCRGGEKCRLESIAYHDLILQSVLRCTSCRHRPAELSASRRPLARAGTAGSDFATALFKGDSSMKDGAVSQVTGHNAVPRAATLRTETDRSIEETGPFPNICNAKIWLYNEESRGLLEV
jgi:hypothetical protein